MVENFSDKVANLAQKIQNQGQDRLRRENLGCDINLVNAMTKIKIGNKYTKIDSGNCGRYMIDNATGDIFGIKAYGVIHKGRHYGNLDTIEDWDWSDYHAKRNV